MKSAEPAIRRLNESGTAEDLGFRLFLETKAFYLREGKVSM
jgi:hypothetical protein